MEHAIKKQQVIPTKRVFTEGNQVYTHSGRNKRFQVPLRWIPVAIPK